MFNILVQGPAADREVYGAVHRVTNSEDDVTIGAAGELRITVEDTGRRQPQQKLVAREVVYAPGQWTGYVVREPIADA